MTAVMFAALTAFSARAQDPVFDVIRHRLPNGMQVWIKPRATTRAVTVRVVVKVGFRNEPVADSQLAHLLEHMLFKGTQRHTEVEMRRMLDAKGAYHNGFTSLDSTAYVVSIVDRELPLAMEWLREILLEPALDPQKLKQARQDVYSEQEGQYPRFIERIVKTGWFQPLPLRVADELFPQVQLTDRAIARLEHVDRTHLLDFRNRYYVPNNMAVIVVGNVDPADVLRRAEAAYGRLPTRPLQTSDYLGYRPPQLPRQEIRTRLMPPAGQMTEVWRGVITRGASDPDRYVLRVINAWLRRRTFEEVRSKRALAYSVGTNFGSFAEFGYLIADARPQRDRKKEDQTHQIFRQLFEELRRAPLPARDIEEAKDNITGTMARVYENNSALAALYEELFLITPFEQPLANGFDRINAVTAADVLRVARARLGDDQVFTARARPTLSYAQAIVVGVLMVIGVIVLLLFRSAAARAAALRSKSGG
jgi:predicted Zn-dependent peptidase